MLHQASGSVYVWKVLDESSPNPADSSSSSAGGGGGGGGGGGSNGNKGGDGGNNGNNTNNSYDYAKDNTNSSSKGGGRGRIDPDWKGAQRQQSASQAPGAMFSQEPFHVWTGHKKHVIDMR